MNFKALVIVAISTCGTLISQAQSQDKVLFTLGETPYYSEEFKRIYNKNLDLIQDNSQRDINRYLELYVLYKIKVEKAYELKLDENPTYKNELKTNRDQLAERYLTDERMTDELVSEAYDRSLKEINADHILFLTKSFAEPADTLIAYNKAIQVRKQILAGANFNEMAKKYSEDPSAKDNGGALGYFSVFKMVYPFETGAYKTAVDSVSMPVRSQFGYHLIKVNNIRENRGERSIAHLMLLKPESDDVESNKAVEVKIKEIERELKEGADFDDLVRQYSQDANTAQFGGVLQRFGVGTMNAPEFEEAAFSLENNGDVSQPVQTAFGWHLIKLIQKHPLPSLDEVKASLENRVQRDSRSRVINEQLVHKIKSRYTLVEDQKLKKQITALVNADFYKNSWKLPANESKFQKPLIVIDKNKELTAWDFLNYIQKNQQAYRGVEPLNKALELAYEKFLERELKSYYVANLEREFPEFDYTVKEYREGLLLFDLMEKEIWNKAQSDTLGYTAYYEKHKSKYLQKARIALTAYDFKDAKKAKKAFKKWSKQIDLIPAETAGVAGVTGVYEADSPEVISRKIPLQKGVYQNPDKKEELIVVNSIEPARVLELEQVRAQVVQEYQEAFEEAWIQGIKDEKVIKVNQEVLEEVKRELKKG